MPERIAVVAAGGTGGHMFPAQALAEELIRRGWRILLATDLSQVDTSGSDCLLDPQGLGVKASYLTQPLALRTLQCFPDLLNGLGH